MTWGRGEPWTGVITRGSSKIKGDGEGERVRENPFGFLGFVNMYLSVITRNTFKTQKDIHKVHFYYLIYCLFLRLAL